MSSFDALMLFISLMVIPPCCVSQQKFEDLHSRGLKQNPARLTVKLHTRDNKVRYTTAEIIKLELSITSLSDDLYTVETATQQGDEVVLQDPSQEPRQIVDGYGVVCCSSAVKPLSKDPVNVATRLNLSLPPGEYSLFVRTKRVSRGWLKPGHYGEGPVLTSDVLHLTVTPDHN